MVRSADVEAVNCAEDLVFHQAGLAALSGVFSLVEGLWSMLGPEETSKQQRHFDRLAEEIHPQVVHVSTASAVGANSEIVS